jgi:hypothetical protein
MREDVKDLLHQAVGWYEPPTLEPEHLARRHRAQQRRARITSGAVALAVFVAAGTLTWSAFGPSGNVGPGGPEPATDATADVHGVSFTYPRSWTLVDLWPLASSIASWPEPIGSSIIIPERTPEQGGLPLIQLSSEDLGLPSLCGTELTGEEAVLYVALNGGPFRVNPDGSPIWTRLLSKSDGPCGRGWYAYEESSTSAPDGTTGSVPYLVFAGFGPNASQADQDAIFRAFDSLTLALFDYLRPPTQTSPSYVVPGLESPSSATSNSSVETPATSVFSSCPDASDAVAVEPRDASAAVEAATQFLWGPDASAVLDPVAERNGLDPSSGTGKEKVRDSRPGSEDMLVPAACGAEVAAATYAVTFDDGTASASLDFTLYVIKRSEGWEVWGEY